MKIDRRKIFFKKATAFFVSWVFLFSNVVFGGDLCASNSLRARSALDREVPRENVELEELMQKAIDAAFEKVAGTKEAREARERTNADKFEANPPDYTLAWEATEKVLSQKRFEKLRNYPRAAAEIANAVIDRILGKVKTPAPQDDEGALVYPEFGTAVTSSGALVGEHRGEGSVNAQIEQCLINNMRWFIDQGKIAPEQAGILVQKIKDGKRDKLSTALVKQLQDKDKNIKAANGKVSYTNGPCFHISYCF